MATQNTYIPQTHQSLAQLQSQYGILSSSPSYNSTVSADIVKPTTVYTYTTSSSGTGQVVQMNEKNQILPQTNIYSSFDPSLNQQVTYTQTTVVPQRTPSSHSVQVAQGSSPLPEYNPYQYAVKQVSQSYQPQQAQQEGDERVKKSKKNGGNSDDSSDSSDDENKQVTELKFNKKNWGKAYILFAQSYIEGLNNKLTSKEAHISQLIKVTDQKDQQIQQLSIELNQLRISGGASSTTVVNVQGSHEYILLQNEFVNLRQRCEELEIDNQQLAQIVQTKDEEKNDLLTQIVLLNTQIEAISITSKPQTVVLQSNFSPEAEIWKKKCGELESELNRVKMSQSSTSNIQIEIVNMQLKDRNAEIERLKAQIEQLKKSQEGLVKLEIENNSLQNQIKSLNSQITILNGQIQSLQAQAGENSNARLNITTLELKLRDYEAQIQRLELQLSQAGGQKSRLDQLESQLISLNAQLQQRELEVNELRQRCQNYEAQLINANNTAELDSLKRALSQQQQQSEYEIRKRDTEIQELKQRLANYEAQLINAANSAELEQVKRSLREQQQLADNQLRQKEVEIQELRQRCANYEQQLSNNQQNLIELENLRRALREYEEKLKQLESQGSNNSAMEAHINELNSQIYNLSQQLKIQNQDSNDLRNRCESLVRQLQEAEAKYQGVLRQYEESEYNNKVIIQQNAELIGKIQQLEYQLSQSSQTYILQTQITQLQESYFNLLSQFVLVCGALESQSGNKQSSYDINLYANQNNDMEIKILRQDNTDLANKCVLLQNQIAQKDAEIQQAFYKFNEIEQSNKIIIDQNSDLLRQLQDKDSEILRLKSNDSSSQVLTLQLEVSDWKSKYEQSKSDILVVAQQVERLKDFLAEKDNELISLRSKVNQLTFLEGENSKLRLQVQKLEEELYQLKRSDRISAPDNNHQLILQLTQRETDLEDHKKRLALYVLKNAELSGEIEFLKSKKLQGGDDLSSIGSQADKDQLIHKYRIENKRLNEDLNNLQILVKNYQTEIRQYKGSKGCGYGCA